MSKMTIEEMQDVLNKAPEGAEYWTSGYTVEYRKVVNNCYFGFLDGEGWVEIHNKGMSQEIIDKGYWLSNLVKELLKRRNQAKEVEWGNEMLPPVGAKCVYFVSNQEDYPKDNHLREMICVAHVGGFDGLVDNGLAVLVSSDFSFSTVCNDSWIRKIESPEDKEKREREEAAKDMGLPDVEAWFWELDSIDRKGGEYRLNTKHKLAELIGKFKLNLVEAGYQK